MSSNTVQVNEGTQAVSDSLAPTLWMYWHSIMCLREVANHNVFVSVVLIVTFRFNVTDEFKITFFENQEIYN